MKRHSHEAILADSPPTPDQLHRLASIGAASAAERQKLRSMQKYERAHFFVDEVDITGSSESEEPTSFIRHRMAGRVGIRAATQDAPKTWSLKFYDTYWVKQEPGYWLAERTLYSFEWHRLRAEMARRSIRVISDYYETPDTDLGDLIDGFAAPDDMPAMWHAGAQMEQVTSDDCEELIAEAARYYEMFRQPI